MPATNRNLTKNEQLLLGIEQIAFGNHYVMNQKKSLNEMIDMMYYFQQTPDELKDDQDDSNDQSSIQDGVGASNSIQKNYQNYRRLLTEKYGVIIDFKRHIFSGLNSHPEIYRSICSFYLKSISFNFDFNALDKWLQNEQQRFEVLTRLVMIKYYIKFGLLLNFDYEKLMSSTQSERKIIPMAITSRNGYLDVIGYDPSTDEMKYYILSCITQIHSDLWQEFEGGEWNYKQSENFDVDEFEKKSPNASFKRETQRYTIRLSGNSYHHFRNTYHLDYTPIDQENDNEYVTITFETTDTRMVKSLLFDYGVWCKLIEPKKIIDEFKEKLGGILEHYENNI